MMRLMTETEWRTSDDSIEMLKWLGDKISPRKMLLFGCALCHKLEHLLRHKSAIAAIGEIEQCADNLLNAKDLWHAHTLAYSSLRQCKPEWRASYYARCAVVCVIPPTVEQIAGMNRIVQGNFRLALQIAAEKQKTDAAQIAFENACTIEADLLRDIVGNPFSKAASSWPSFNSDVAKTKAEFVYVNRRFDLLPEIADILEVAGCTSDEILNHCRQPSEHVRGCWVIDELLSKS
jgi:hypothetical protein